MASVPTATRFRRSSRRWRRRALGKPKDVERADRMLSEAFVAYMRDLKRDPGLGILYVDPSLRPAPPSALAALLGAANAPSLSAYVRDMGWMSPIYAELRKALADHRYASDRERAAADAEPAARAYARRRPRALHHRQCRPAAALHL